MKNNFLYPRQRTLPVNIGNSNPWDIKDLKLNTQGKQGNIHINVESYILVTIPEKEV